MTKSSVSEADLKRYLDAAIDVARMAGARADVWWRKRDTLKVEEKGEQDFVSIADRKTEELIREELAKRFSDHAFLGEEGDKAKPNDGQPIWVIDPIDGTTNFLRGMPMWAVSVGLVVDNDPIVGVIVAPRQDEVFAAAKGAGATLDNEPIAVSNITEMSKAQIGLGSSHRVSIDEVCALETKLHRAGAGIRRLGSACIHMAWTACGRLDGYIEQHLNSWDTAAGIVIVREAGGRINEHATGEWLHNGNPLVVSTPAIFDEAMAVARRSPA